jgi:hypothetical protein
MAPFDLAQYLKSKMSTQAPQPNRPRSKAPQLQSAEAARQKFAQSQAAPPTASQSEAAKRQYFRMYQTTAQIGRLRNFLKAALYQQAMTKYPEHVQPLTSAVFECERLIGEIEHERATLGTVNEARMRVRQELMQNVIQKIADMANVVKTAGKLTPEDITSVVKGVESHLGYFDPRLMRTLGLVRPSKFAEPFGA